MMMAQQIIAGQSVIGIPERIIGFTLYIKRMMDNRMLQYVDEAGMPLKKQDIFRDFRIKDCIWSQKQFWNCCYGRGHIVCTVQWNKLFKRELFEKVRYPKGKVREDEFVIHQIVAQCDKIACISEKLHFY